MNPQAFLTPGFLHRMTLELQSYCDVRGWKLEGVYIGRAEYRTMKQCFAEHVLYAIHDHKMEKDGPSFRYNGVSFWIVDRPESHFYVAIDKDPQCPIRL